MSWCSEDVWTMLMSRLLSEEEEEEENARSGGGVGVELLLSKVLLEMDNVFSEGKKLLSECLESDFKSAQCRGEPLSIPQNLLRVYDLKEEAYWVKEGISLEELKSYFPKAIVNSTPHSFKEEQNSSHATHLSREEEEEGMELGEEDEEEEEEEDEEEEEYDGEIKSGIKDELDEMYEEGDSRDSDGVSPSSSRHSSYYKKRGSRVCQLCNKIFSKDFKNFDVHVTQCELIASYGDVRDGRTCPKCHKKYKRSYLIGRHLDLCQGDIMENGQLWSRDGEDGNLFKCERCLKTYKSRHHFASHLATCERKKKSSCNKCNKYFPTQEELHRHPCPKYSGDRKFSCQLCDYACYYGPQLTKHYTSKHGGKRDYCCETCGKMYADPSVLATHRRTHSEPSHKCQECGKAFHRRATLTRHMTMHFSLNLPCETCGKCFSNQLYLNRHRNSQHPPDGIIVTHPCPHCSSSYREKKFLKKHIRDKHTFDSSGNPEGIVQQINHPHGKEPERQTPEDCKALLGIPFMHTIHS